MRILIFHILLSSTQVVGCSLKKDSGNPQQQIDSQVQQPVENIHSIELINGEKWQVAEHMLAHIRNMEKDVSGYDKTQQNGFENLASKLESNTELLTSNCTMTGQAHDELHKWLLPFIDLVGEFSEVENPEAATALFEKIKSSFTEFNQYFI